MIRNHPMFAALSKLEGNSRISVLTEPLWGIPHSLYTPFASVYMLSFGITDAQIGFIVSLTLLIRALSAAVSGAITDKLGRRLTTVIFDTISWSIPCLLWAFAQNIWWFYAGALLNGLFQITDNSWTCLLVEDADKRMIVHIYNWIYVAAQLSVFFAPLAGLLVGRLGMVLALRILYGFSFISMTLKFIILYVCGTETRMGVQRMAESKNKSFFSILAEYKALVPRFFRSGEMQIATIVAVLFTAANTLMDSFFGIYTTQALGLADHTLSYFPIIRSAVMLIFLFFIQPRMMRFSFRGPMLLGILLYVASHVVLIVPPLFMKANGLLLPIAYTLFQSCAHGLCMPRKDTIVALSLSHEERARMNSIMTLFIIGFNIPFGSLAGVLSKLNRSLPFALNIVLFAVAFAVVLGSKRLSRLASDGVQA